MCSISDRGRGQRRLIHVDENQAPDFDLPMCLGKFLALGMDLPDVIARATANPARVLGETDSIGTLKPGARADIAIFEVQQGAFTFHDTVGAALTGRQRLRNVATFIAGRHAVASGAHVPAAWVEMVHVNREVNA